MIPVPSNVRVWLSVGRTDMRRGMTGLALQVQQALGRDPLVIFSSSGVPNPTWSRSSGMMASACLCMQNGLNGGSLSGRLQRTARSRSRPHSSPICLTALTGETRGKPGGRPVQDKV